MLDRDPEGDSPGWKKGVQTMGLSADGLEGRVDNSHEANCARPPSSGSLSGVPSEIEVTGPPTLSKDEEMLNANEKIASKKFYVRCSGYKDVRVAITREGMSHAQLHEFGLILHNALEEINVVAQLEGYEAIMVLLSALGSESAPYVRDYANVLVTKGLAVSREHVRTKAEEVLLKLVQVDGTDTVCSILVEKGFSHRNAKVCIAAAGVVKAAIDLHGLDVVFLKGLLPAILKCSSHKDAAVRHAVRSLTAELSKWVSIEVLEQSLLSKLRDSSKGEYKEAIENMQKSQHDDRIDVTNVNAQLNKADRSVRLRGAELHVPIEFDSMIEVGSRGEKLPFAENVCASLSSSHVDILSVLPKSFWAKTQRDAKWKMKKDALSSLLAVCEASPRFTPSSDYGELIAVLKLLLNDNHVAVVIGAATCLEAIAKGLCSALSAHTKQLYKVLVDKLKDKNSKVVDQVLKTMKSLVLHQCSSPSEIAEIIIIVLKHSTSKIVCEGIKWVLYCAESVKETTLDLLFKSCFGSLIVACSAAEEKTRDGASEVIARFALRIGDSILDKISETKYLDDLKKKKIKNIIDGLRTSTIADSGHSVLPSIPRSDGTNHENAEHISETACVKSVCKKRKDISSEITGALVGAINDKSLKWPDRLETFGKLDQILLRADHYILPHGIAELFLAVKSRLNDSNKNVIALSNKAIANIIGATGSQSVAWGKGLIADVSKHLGDSKKIVRDSAIQVFNAWFDHVPQQREKTLAIIANILLCAGNIGPDGRKDVLNWFASKLDGVAIDWNSFGDLTSVVKAVLKSCKDKNVEVRKAADLVIANITRPIAMQFIVIGNDLREELLQKGDSSKQSANGNTEDHIKTGKNFEDTEGVRPSRSNSSRGNAAGPSVELPGMLLGSGTAGKIERVRKVRAIKWKFEEPRPEFISETMDLLKSCCSAEIHRKLFSKDFKEQIDAVHCLRPVQFPDECIANIDLLFKWCVWKICSGCNPSMLLKIFEFLGDLITVASSSSYTLSDYEASLIIPCLIEHCGANSEKLRLSFRKTIRRLVAIYDRSKISLLLLDGVRCKNSRTRIECVDEIGSMILTFGADLCKPFSKFILSMIPLVGERDVALRTGSINTLCLLYREIGEEFYRAAGPDMSDAIRGMLDEKFKRMSKVAEKSTSQQEQTSHFFESNGVDGASQHIIAAELHSKCISGMEEQFSLNRIQCIFAAIGSFDEGEAIKGMKDFCDMLCDSDREDNELEIQIDHVVSILTRQIQFVFRGGMDKISVRLCKYVLNTLMQIYGADKSLCAGISSAVLRSLTQELLRQLLNDKLTTITEGKHISRALNVLMLRVLENSDRTLVFTILLGFLRRKEEESDEKNKAFIELVLKCLIKLTKTLHSMSGNLYVDQILMDIHLFLVAYPNSSFRKAGDDMPLRTVKTVLFELCKLRGPSMLESLSLIPRGIEPPPAVVQYIQLMLVQLQEREDAAIPKETVILGEMVMTTPEQKAEKGENVGNASAVLSGGQILSVMVVDGGGHAAKKNSHDCVSPSHIEDVCYEQAATHALDCSAPSLRQITVQGIPQREDKENMLLSFDKPALPQSETNRDKQNSQTNSTVASLRDRLAKIRGNL